MSGLDVMYKISSVLELLLANGTVGCQYSHEVLMLNQAFTVTSTYHLIQLWIRMK